MAVLLFDLDMTLVNSSAVESLRRNGMWAQVMSNIDRIVPFKVSGKIQPHQLPAAWKEAGHAVGIVTSSPQDYAKTVLKRFDIPYDTLVAYHDTENHKPDPEPILLALKRLGVAPKTAAYLGDDAVDVEASYHAGVHSLGAGWGVNNWTEIAAASPTIMLHRPDDLFPFNRITSRTYCGEVDSDREPLWHPGSVLWLDRPQAGYALGRYFSTDDSRHALSSLSATILKHKSSKEPAVELGKLLANSIKQTGYSKTFDYIVGVPPKPNADRDRLGEILAEIAKVISRPMYLPEALRCVKDYGDLKKMKPLERVAAVSGAFRSQYTYNNNRVLLLDDVLTTGATSNECLRVLLANKAVSPVLLVIAKDQRTFVHKECPKCGSRMKVRRNSKDGSKFWGCSGYPTCKHTENIG